MESLNPFRLICYLFLAFSLSSLEAVAVEQEGAEAPIRTLQKVSDHLYRYQYAYHVSMVLDTPDGLLITDPSSIPAMIALKAELKARFDKPVKYMVYSHYHPDHIGGAGVFADATVVAHEKTRHVLAEDSQGDVKLPLPDITFTRKMTLSLGGKKVELFPVEPETHAEGLIAMMFVDSRTLNAVDVMVVRGVAWMNFNNHRFPSVIDTLKNLEKLEFDRIANGHFRIATRADLVEYRQYLEALRDAVQQAIDTGKSIREAKETIKLDQFSHFDQYEEWLSFNVEGAYRLMKAPEYGAHISHERVITPYEDFKNTDEVAVMCALCHGGDGMGTPPHMPRLAGQSYEYLLKTLEDFREGRRYESNMAELKLYLTTDELQRIARYYSDLNSVEYEDDVRQGKIWAERYLKAMTPAKTIADIPLLTVDPNLKQAAPPSEVEKRRMIAAGKEKTQLCVACHGMDGRGTAGNFPDIGGQLELYLVNQLRAMKQGGRLAPLMKAVVDNMSDADISEVAAYYASQPWPNRQTIP